MKPVSHSAVTALIENASNLIPWSFIPASDRNCNCTNVSGSQGSPAADTYLKQFCPWFTRRIHLWNAIRYSNVYYVRGSNPGFDLIKTLVCARSRFGRRKVLSEGALPTDGCGIVNEFALGRSDASMNALSVPVVEGSFLEGPNGNCWSRTY